MLKAGTGRLFRTRQHMDASAWICVTVCVSAVLPCAWHCSSAKPTGTAPTVKPAILSVRPFTLWQNIMKKKKTLLCFSLKQRGTFERTRLTASRQPRAGNRNLNKSKQNELIDVKKVQTLRLCRQQEVLRPLIIIPHLYNSVMTTGHYC